MGFTAWSEAMPFKYIDVLSVWREKRIMSDDIMLSWLVAIGCVSAILLCTPISGT